MNAIIGACRPYVKQNRHDDCGSYFVDLTESSGSSIGRSIENLPLHSSCTYRAFSTCGYPEFSYRVAGPEIAEDFDVAWAFMDGLSITNELDRWDFDLMTDYQNSSASSRAAEYAYVRQPVNRAISDEQWDTCKGITRNLWVTVTRVKDSTQQKGE